MNQPLNIAIAGLGTVGAATVRLLLGHGRLLEQRCGRKISIAAVSARDRNRDRGVDLSGINWVDDPLQLVELPGVDAVP